MGNIFLDVCLFIVFLATLLITSFRDERDGGYVLLLAGLPTLFLYLVIFTVCILRGRFDWAPGGKFLHFVLLMGLLAGLAGAAIGSYEFRRSAWAPFMTAVPFLVLAAAALSVHGLDTQPAGDIARTSAGVTLGLIAAGGWVLSGAMMVGNIREQVGAAEKREQEIQQLQVNNAAFDRTEFDKLPANAEIWQMFPFMNSHNEEVRAECRRRMAKLPTLDQELMKHLGTGWAEHAIDYLADIHPGPGPEYTPAMRAFLEKDLLQWQSTLATHPNPGIYELNLRDNFEAAAKVQKAGGDLRPQLHAWAKFLAPLRGLGGLAREIDRIAGAK